MQDNTTKLWLGFLDTVIPARLPLLQSQRFAAQAAVCMQQLFVGMSCWLRLSGKVLCPWVLLSVVRPILMSSNGACFDNAQSCTLEATCLASHIVFDLPEEVHPPTGLGGSTPQRLMHLTIPHSADPRNLRARPPSVIAGLAVLSMDAATGMLLDSARCDSIGCSNARLKSW